MYANAAGIICAGCDCGRPRAYGKTMDAAKERVAETAEAAHWRRESEGLDAWLCLGCTTRAEEHAGP